jgi:hypothetical protein
LCSSPDITLEVPTSIPVILIKVLKNSWVNNIIGNSLITKNVRKNLLKLFLHCVVRIKFQQMPHVVRYSNFCKGKNFRHLEPGRVYSRKVKWTVSIPRMGEMRYACTFLVGNPYSSLADYKPRSLVFFLILKGRDHLRGLNVDGIIILN